MALFRISGPKGCLRWTTKKKKKSSIFVRSLPVVGKCTGVEFLARRSLPPLHLLMCSVILCCGGDIQLVFRSFSQGIFMYL